MDLSRSALVLIDFQKDFLDPKGRVQNLAGFNLPAEVREPLLKNARLLIQRARAMGRPVIWVKTILRQDHLDSALSPVTREVMGLTAEKDFLTEGSWGTEMVEGFSPEPDDFIVVKKGHSAFQFTHLDRVLTNLGIKACVTIGGGPLDCLADTVRQGGALSYEMVVPSDATGYPLESGYLHNLRNRVVAPSTEELLASLSSSEESHPSADKVAMLLIDLQNEFVHPDGFHERLGFAHMSEEERSLILGNNQRLLKSMRAKGNPIIFVTTTYREDRLDDASSPAARRNRPLPPGEKYLLEGSWGAQVLEGLEVEEKDLVITKKGRSCFGFTPLVRILRNIGVDQCIVTGGGIYGCLEDSVREGVAYGYRFTVVSDATYEPNSPVLKILADRVECKPTDDVLADLSEMAGHSTAEAREAKQAE